MTNVLPTVADVVDAEARLRGWVVETPVLESEVINARVGARVLLKAECLQHTGSFKIRGALNRLLQLSADERAAGVVAFSSGNHAQAVALAARWLKVPATIVMPADAPKIKVERTRENGAEVIDPPSGGDRVTFASTVRLEDESGKEIRYWIVGSDEADPQKGRISILSPLARTLIGKRVGDSVTAQLPGGKKTFEILEVNFPWSD